MIRLIRFIFGYVSFKAKGDFPERLFNQLSVARVPIWGMKRRGSTITANMMLRDYKKIRQYRAKSRVRTQVIDRVGLPFILKQYRLRVGLAAGVLFYVASLIFMSSFIWNIEVVGNSTVPTKEIIAICEELGLFEGAKISEIDQEIIRTKLSLYNSKIAWASVNIEGVKATVNISESIGEGSEKTGFCNLVAKRDGVITELLVTEGQIAVKLGQTVTAGELLVSGVTEYKDGTVSFGRSSGQVMAETMRELSCLATFVQNEKVYVDKPIKRRVLSVFGIDIPLYFGRLKGHFDVETKVKQIEHNSMYLPIRLTQTTFRQTDIRAYEIGEAEAKELALKMLLELEQKELLNAEILDKQVVIETTEKGVRVTGKYKCVENIANEDLLLIYSQE